MSTEKLNLSGSRGIPPPLTHLRRGSRCCLDLNPRKIFKQDDLVILKPFQTTLKEQSLGQPMRGVDSSQFPAGRRPTGSGSQPCEPASVCRALLLRNYAAMVKWEKE